MRMTTAITAVGDVPLVIRHTLYSSRGGRSLRGIDTSSDDFLEAPGRGSVHACDFHRYAPHHVTLSAGCAAGAPDRASPPHANPGGRPACENIASVLSRGSTPRTQRRLGEFEGIDPPKPTSAPWIQGGSTHSSNDSSVDPGGLDRFKRRRLRDGEGVDPPKRPRLRAFEGSPPQTTRISRSFTPRIDFERKLACLARGR